MAIGDRVAPAASHGVWIGLLHLGDAGAQWLREAISDAHADGSLAHARLAELLARVLTRGHGVHVVWTRGDWVNVNNLADLVDASGLS